MTIEEMYHIIQKENLNTNRFSVVDEEKDSYASRLLNTTLGMGNETTLKIAAKGDFEVYFHDSWGYIILHEQNLSESEACKIVLDRLRSMNDFDPNNYSWKV